MQQNIGTDSARWDASLTAFNALAAAEQTAWGDEAAALNIEETSLPYAGDPAISPGAALFAYARTLFRLGLYTAPGAPDGTNATAWAADIIS
ncbi:MAG: hypothetical protein JXA33_15265 [Anaerolineae bacterium]|nr:hypothetical protein [Anaerolineae bacterium]